MQMMTGQDAPDHTSYAPGPTSITTLFCGERDSRDVGMVRITVPSGAGIADCRHARSDVILVPMAGSVRVVTGDQTVDLDTGEAVLIARYESVSVTNPHHDTAQLLLAGGPAAFTAAVDRWTHQIAPA